MNIAFEVIVFLESCVLGVVFGAFYDVFRIVRLSFKNPKFFVFIQDVLYFSIITLASFVFIVVQNNGYLRAFLIIGELLGAILYFYTLSILIMKSANIIINAIKRFLILIYKITIKPFVKLFTYINSKLKGIFAKCDCKIKNIVPIFKIHLK